VRIPLSDIEPVASILGSSRLIRGIAKLDGRLVSLLDLQGILAEPAAESEGADALAA
jgi:chemotaxis signal transduction protein